MKAHRDGRKYFVRKILESSIRKTLELLDRRVNMPFFPRERIKTIRTNKVILSGYTSFIWNCYISSTSSVPRFKLIITAIYGFRLGHRDIYDFDQL